MNKTGKMELHEFILALLIFSFFMLSGTLLIGNVISNYDVNETTEKFSSIYNKVNETYTIASEAEDEIINADITDDSPWEALLKGSYKAIKLIGNTIQLFKDIIEEITDQMGIPSWVMQFAVTAFIVVIIFAIIYLIFRVK